MFVRDAYYWSCTHPGLSCMRVAERFIILIVFTVSFSLHIEISLCAKTEIACVVCHWGACWGVKEYFVTHDIS